MRQSYSVVMVSAVAALMLAAPAAAAPSSSLSQYKPTSTAALAHFEAGNRAYKSARITARPLADRVRDLKQAIDEYTAGQAFEDAPAFDYNIAHAARLLVDHPTAVAHLQRFLERAHPDDQLRQAVENEISELDPSGAIRADLRKPKAPALDTKATPTTTATPSTTAQPSPTVPALATTTTAAPSEPRGWRRLGWGLTAAGVVGAGVTTWLTVSASGLDSDAKDTSRAISERVDLQQQADSRRHTALIVGIGSGAAVVLGIVTLAIPGRSNARPSTTAWNLGITGRGIAVLGRF